MAQRTLLLDSTLADGVRAVDVSLGPLDEVRIALRLDELGVDFIECDPAGGGAAFFREARRVELRNARLAARVRLGRPGAGGRNAPLRLALRTGAPVIVVHASPRDGKRVAAAVRQVVRAGRVALVRFEAWFAARAQSPERAVDAVRAAATAGAAYVILRARGSARPREVGEGVASARAVAGDRLGVGANNDSGLALACVLEGVARGAALAEGTMNGYGPRCGLADLVQIAANLSVPATRGRSGKAALPPDRLRLLAPTARFVAELANHPIEPKAPFVGAAAWDDPEAPMDPRAVGATRRGAVEDERGHSLLARLARARGARGEQARALLGQLRALEARGFRYEGAEASFELALLRLAGRLKPYFEVARYRAISERRNDEVRSEATVQVLVGGVLEHTAATGIGPIHALDLALRRGLDRFYPSLRDMRLLDYKVRLLPSGHGTAATARVLAVSGDGRARWATGGVSEDLVEASFLAIVDGITWKLHRDGVQPR